MTGRITGLTECMTFSAVGNISGAVTFNSLNGQVFSATANGAVTSVALSNLPAAGQAFPFILEITNGGNQAFTWGAAWKFPSGAPPTLTNGGTDLIAFYTRDAGTTYRMVGIQLNSH
jgi:hypothetical protein